MYMLQNVSWEKKKDENNFIMTPQQSINSL